MTTLSTAEPNAGISTAHPRGIIFTADSVRAILAGTKTQTRRRLKFDRLAKRPAGYGECVVLRVDGGWSATWPGYEHPLVPVRAPFINGQHLWVKEAWRPRIAHHHGEGACDCADAEVTYAADNERRFVDEREIPDTWVLPRQALKAPLTPLFMPRWASRITLEVTAVRCERLLDLSVEDAIDEGLRPCESGAYRVDDAEFDDPRQAYFFAWDGINPRANHDTNPWVWRIVFRRVDSGAAVESGS